MSVETSGGGTGSRLAKATVVVCGVASLVASLLSILSIWLQTKNYRKPLLQRYVVRILLMVPIYAISSWTSIVSLKTSSWIAPVRDIYEAFTIYTFFQLLINFVGGERALIMMTRGRAPVQHAWPLNQCFPKVDISDPYTFLTIKRGILQYAWLKPILAVLSIVMKATGTYQEGYLGVSSGYLWTGIIYNISVTISLYSLALFWVCMHNDLKPFRPVPKFLCIKLVIFASYWQGFFLSILQWLGALENDIPGYTPDNLAAAIQDSLICFEMPIFAIAHWYAFSWHDYADSSVSAARMPVVYALRDSFGIKDLIEDSKETFRGENYQYRFFDSGDNVMAHEESNSRVARVMDGMRYERGGKSKYWIPRPGELNSRTPLLGSPSSSSRRGSQAWSKRGSSTDDYQAFDGASDARLDEEDERLFTNARLLEFGDWNYPVITANEGSREPGLSSDAAFTASVPYSDEAIDAPVEESERRSKRVRSHDQASIVPSSSAAEQPVVRKAAQRHDGSLQSEQGPSHTSATGSLLRSPATDDNPARGHHDDDDDKQSNTSSSRNINYGNAFDEERNPWNQFGAPG